MKLGSRMDYHGSRVYAPDLPSSTAGSWVNRLTGGLAAWAKQKLELVLRPDAGQAAETIWLVQGRERFPGPTTARSGVAPFPEGEARTRRPAGNRPVSE